MKKKRITNCQLPITMLVVWSLVTGNYAPVTAQSPYTRYGYGQLSDQSFASQRGMGGIGYGLRNPKDINPLNPASFSTVDSMTFMLDLGLKGQMGFFDDNGKRSSKANAGLEYVAVQFPIGRKIGIGVGIEPISYVGYKYGNTENQYEGSGGLNKFYGSVAYEFRQLSAGIKIGSAFGDITHSTVSPSVSYKSDSLHASGLSLDFGVQYRHPLSDNTEVVIGAVFTPKITLNTQYSESSGTLISDLTHATKDLAFQQPTTLGIGASYRKFNQYTVGADLTFQNWANAQYFGKTDTLTNRLKINLGGEYNYKLRYRAGAYYSSSYFETVKGGYDEYGITLGVGVPMLDRRSYLNFAVAGEMLRPKAPSMVSEYYVKITISYTFNELWFRKRKML
ncbi:hypothetical protein SAMD00024442_60_6 [Candidatus Symbiothrix dinenymphae]|nr:hypothetical protein SAMD00024442_60_6 [Candidatus Symbiothrix dinenymphae]